MARVKSAVAGEGIPAEEEAGCKTISYKMRIVRKCLLGLFTKYHKTETKVRWQRKGVSAG
jgi:hypothetical protein